MISHIDLRVLQLFWVEAGICLSASNQLTCAHETVQELAFQDSSADSGPF